MELNIELKEMEPKGIHQHQVCQSAYIVGITIKAGRTTLLNEKAAVRTHKTVSEAETLENDIRWHW